MNIPVRGDLGQPLTIVLIVTFLLLSCFNSHSSSQGVPGSRNDNPFCRHLRNSRSKLVNSTGSQVSSKYENVSNLECSIVGRCSALNCSFLYGRETITAGLKFSICENPPQVKFWVKSLELNPERWEMIFKPKSKPETIQIPTKDGNTTRILLIVEIHAEQVDTKAKAGVLPVVDFLRFNSSISICSGTGPCQFTAPLVNLGRFSINSVCDERPVAPRAKIPSISSLKCDPNMIFSCGEGQTCMFLSPGVGYCTCIRGYVNVDDICVKRTDIPGFTTTPAPSNATTGSNSGTMSAILTILILSTLGALGFVGYKMRVHHRIRSQIPVGCLSWPRGWALPFPLMRNQRRNDQVNMVNPLYPGEDDEPPLM